MQTDDERGACGEGHGQQLGQHHHVKGTKDGQEKEFGPDDVYRGNQHHEDKRNKSDPFHRHADFAVELFKLIQTRHKFSPKR